MNTIYNVDVLNHCGTVNIDTQRIQLRSFCHTDNDDMLRYWISDPEIQSLISEPVYSTKQEVAVLLTKYIESYDKLDYYRWAIVLKETNECIGQIAFFLIDNKNHFGEIEAWITSIGLKTKAFIFCEKPMRTFHSWDCFGQSAKIARR